MNILNKLTIKHLLMNKKRTIVTIIGVILSTALMVGIGLIFATIRDNSIKDVIASNGPQHLKAHINLSQKSIIESDKDIKKYEYTYDVGFAEVKNLDDRWVSDASLYYHLLSQDNMADFKLSKGVLPSNDNEIIVNKRLSSYLDREIKTGDVLSLDVGLLTDDGEIVFNTYSSSVKLIDTKRKDYKIVGIYENDYGDGLDIYTYNAVSDNVIASITFKNINKAYDNTEELGFALEFENICSKGLVCFEELDTNDSLLSMYGISKYSNVMDSMTGIIAIILSLISIGCIIVIYNSFAISVMERKKQFGLFSSIGATRRQLRKTVFFEALIIGLIGIPLGILGGIFGIWVVINVVNSLLSEVFTYPLELSIYPLFMYIPIIFMIVTIFVSALIPSFMASRVSPITAIRQNDDIKIKNKKIKTPKFIRKLFGVEGEIALKNMKRNKKKYRVTIISLFISIVLFVSFSGFADYGIKSLYRYTEMPNYDIEVDFRIDEYNKKDSIDFKKDIDRIIVNEDVKEYVISEEINGLYYKLDKGIYNDRYYNEVISERKYRDDYDTFTIQVVEDRVYEKLKKSLGLKEDKILMKKYITNIDYDEGKRVSKEYEVYKSADFSISLYERDYKTGEYEATSIILDNIYLIDKEIMGEASMLSSNSGAIISESMRDSLGITKVIGEPTNKSINIKASPYKSIDKLLEDIKSEDRDYYYSYYNVTKEMKILSNAIIAVRILLYGFIGLVTLIGVTSVFNTINTSIALRRREFSMLRSIGLTPKGFNKILYFESFFFGLKSLVYGIPVSLFVVYLLHRSFDTMVEFSTLMIPWMSILEALIGVFIIVLISMLYASSKIKKENILEALREENI